MCGGTWSRSSTGGRATGLSPRVRGNHRATARHDTRQRSIPACAGEPFTGCRLTTRCRVYPRVCGGTKGRSRLFWISWGLSPRVRGNLDQAASVGDVLGSIPACAGEPHATACTVRVSEVYPRVCGGTGGASGSAGSPVGLSPRVRGNLRHRTEPDNRHGSIPACAGEPPTSAGTDSTTRVYPRGLSPRVRGNPYLYSDAEVGKGSIPACAGEPTPPATTNSRRKVYPRVCGGTPLGILSGWVVG